MRATVPRIHVSKSVVVTLFVRIKGWNFGTFAIEYVEL